MTRQARQGSQITNVEESAGSTSMATVVWWTRVAPARCTASATPVRPPARARLQERGLLRRSQRSVTPGEAKARAPAGACSGLKLGQHVAKKPGGAAKQGERPLVSEDDDCCVSRG